MGLCSRHTPNWFQALPNASDCYWDPLSSNTHYVHVASCFTLLDTTPGRVRKAIHCNNSVLWWNGRRIGEGRQGAGGESNGQQGAVLVRPDIYSATLMAFLLAVVEEEKQRAAVVSMPILFCAVIVNEAAQTAVTMYTIQETFKYVMQ